MTRTLLIDGDILAYKASAATEQKFDWGEGVESHSADLNEAMGAVYQNLSQLMDELFADEYIIALSDPEKNFRKVVLPTYKSQRTGEKPIHYNTIRRHLLDEHDAKMVPWLEGDDVLGIMSTDPRWKGEKIVVSIDKDMKTIPGLLFSPNEPEVIEVTEAEADRYHLLQSFMGDATDGYKGCPGVGMEKAKFVLNNPVEIGTYEHTFEKGPRKGLSEIRARPIKKTDVWSAIVSYYRAAKEKGIGDYDDPEAEALRQARCARILRTSDYNSKTGKVILWEPKKD
jgi:DNA polymerase I